MEIEKEFEKLVPLQSLLGREFLGLQSARNKEKQMFESANNKMGFNTQAYRLTEMALRKFLEDWYWRVLAAKEKLEGARERLENAEQKVQNNAFGHGITLDRRDIQKIWVRFALERYRLFAKPLKKTYRRYHPGMWKDLLACWKEFNREIKKWMFGGQPFDGSQAMSNMIAFQVKCRLIASIND